MHAPPAGCRLRLEPNGERKQDKRHEDPTRVDLLGDRHADVGRGLRMWRQRLRSPAVVGVIIVLTERAHDQRLSDIAVRCRDG
jgi:hypothetical protein